MTVLGHGLSYYTLYHLFLEIRNENCAFFKLLFNIEKISILNVVRRTRKNLIDIQKKKNKNNAEASDRAAWKYVCSCMHFLPKSSGSSWSCAVLKRTTSRTLRAMMFTVWEWCCTCDRLRLKHSYIGCHMLFNYLYCLNLIYSTEIYFSEIQFSL